MNAPGPSTAAARAKILRDLRARKMARSAHAYVRGNTVQFYQWLEEHDDGRIPKGPDVWICGDCHIGNLGPIADSHGNVEVQIRDLDSTVIGNPAHDLIRLGLSLAMAARSSDLPGITTAKMLEAAMQGYRHALTRRASVEDAPELIRRTFKNSLKRRWRHLARERIEDERPTIPLGEKFWPLFAAERAALDDLFAQEETRSLLTQLHSRDAGSDIVLLDAAYWVKGCSSLGSMRLIALAGIETENRSITAPCLIDIKQAIPAAAPRSATASMPKDQGQRVVAGAQHLSPNLGERMRAASLLGTSVVLRELLPQDIKFEMSNLSTDEAIQAAHYLAHVVGRAHWRQMQPFERTSWANDLKRAHSKTLNAPSWLWSSVVDLVGKHEMGYLEHCRRLRLRK